MAEIITDTAIGLYRRQLQQQHRQRQTDVEPRPARHVGPSPPQPSRLQRNDQLFSPRRRREFTPSHRKDQTYWDRRHRNNEAARRSREKRRLYDIGLERNLVELSKENYVLKVQLIAIKHKFGVSGDDAINAQQIMALLPTNEQMLRTIATRPRTTSLSASSNGQHSDRSSSPTEEPHGQQQRQQRENDRPVDVTSAAGPVSLPASFPSAVAVVPQPPPPPQPQRQTFADGVLDLARGPPRDEPSGRDGAAAGPQPVVWRAFGPRGPGPVAVDYCCPQRSRSPPRPRYDDGDDGGRLLLLQEDAWCRRRPGVGSRPWEAVGSSGDDERDPGPVGLSWAATGPGAVEPPPSWLMVAAAAAAAACAGCALDAAKGPASG